MAGVAEETAKVAGGIVDAMRNQPLAIANIVLNMCFLVFLFYYVSRISTRAEGTVKELFVAQDALYKQWGVIIKDTNELTEKSMHCIYPDDAIKLLQAPRQPVAPPMEMPPRAQGLRLPPLPPLPLRMIEVHE